MEHDSRCEKGRMVEVAERSRLDDGLLYLLRTAEDLCACQARTWGMKIPSRVGLRIAEKKVLRYVGYWEENRHKTPGEIGAAFGKQLNDRLQGLNVINLQDHRDA